MLKKNVTDRWLVQNTQLFQEKTYNDKKNLMEKYANIVNYHSKKRGNQT